METFASFDGDGGGDGDGAEDEDDSEETAEERRPSRHSREPPIVGPGGRRVPPHVACGPGDRLCHRL